MLTVDQTHSDFFIVSMKRLLILFATSVYSQDFLSSSQTGAGQHNQYSQAVFHHCKDETQFFKSCMTVLRGRNAMK